MNKDEFKKIHDRLFNYWYDTYDLSVYSDPDYKHITEDCFVGWSKGTTKNIIKFFTNIQHTPQSIIDVYGGNGKTTKMLGEGFPNTVVYYHNTDTNQTLEAKDNCKGLDNVHFTTELIPSEVVVCLEVMEHIQEPIKFISPLLTNPVCRYYVDGSSFTIDSIGHYREYLDGDKVINNKQFKRYYFNWLKTIGFHQCFSKNNFIHPRFYNGRPNVLVRK